MCIYICIFIHILWDCKAHHPAMMLHIGGTRQFDGSKLCLYTYFFHKSVKHNTGISQLLLKYMEASNPWGYPKIHGILIGFSMKETIQLLGYITSIYGNPHMKSMVGKFHCKGRWVGKVSDLSFWRCKNSGLNRWLGHVNLRDTKLLKMGMYHVIICYIIIWYHMVLSYLIIYDISIRIIYNISNKNEGTWSGLFIGYLSGFPAPLPGWSMFASNMCRQLSYIHIKNGVESSWKTCIYSVYIYIHIYTVYTISQSPVSHFWRVKSKFIKARLKESIWTKGGWGIHIPKKWSNNGQTVEVGEY